MATGGKGEEACSEEVIDSANTAEDLIPQGEENKSPVPLERCGNHGDETLQLYCRDHDEVICNSCVSMQHSSCSNIVSISQNVNDLLDTLTLATVKSELTASQASLKYREKMAESKLTYLDEIKPGILSSIQNHGHMLKDMIDRLVEESKADIENKSQEIESQLKDEIEKIKEDLTELDKREEEFNAADEQKNDSQKFVLLKKYQSRITELRNQGDDIKALRSTTELGYSFNRDIENGLKKFTSLGLVSDQPKSPTQPYTQPPARTITGETKTRVCDKKPPCSASDCCQLSDGSFLVADWNHQRVVKLDDSCSNITIHCQVPGYPYAVCSLEQSEAAVSLRFIQTIQFLNWRNLTLTKCRKFYHNCRGLAFSKGELFVSDGFTRVYVYDKEGKPLRTLGPSTSSPTGLFASQVPQSVFSNADHLAISSDGRKIYVTNWAKGIVCVDREGKQVFTCCDSRLQYAKGVCVDNQGSVFVCIYGSHNVIQLSENGDVIGTLLKRSTLIRYPVSVCYDYKKNKLLVTKETDSSVSVLQLE